jgi:hypothetical protein
MTNVEYLDLRSNALTGSLPLEISLMTNVEYLDPSLNGCCVYGLPPNGDQFDDEYQVSGAWLYCIDGYQPFLRNYGNWGAHKPLFPIGLQQQRNRHTAFET